MVQKSDKVRHPDFARRMLQACDGNLSIPELNFGRLGWFVDEMDRKGLEVTKETVRKWFAGESRPRVNMMQGLAEVLSVDEAWLSTGRSSGVNEKQRKVRNAAADGAVNVVAGFIQMNGGHPAFPAEDDARAQEQKIDLYAIIRGAQYSIHVVTGERGEAAWGLRIPVEAQNTIIIAVLPTGDLSCEFVELEWEKINAQGVRKASFVEVSVDFGKTNLWKPVTSFSERL